MDTKNIEKRDLEQLIVDVGSRFLEQEEYSLNYRLLDYYPKSYTYAEETAIYNKLKNAILEKDKNPIKGRIKEKFYNIMLKLGIDFYSREMKRKLREMKKDIQVKKEFTNSLINDFLKLNSGDYLDDYFTKLHELPNDINSYTKGFYKALSDLGCSEAYLREMLCNILESSKREEIELYNIRLEQEMGEITKGFEELAELRKRYEAEKESEVKGAKKVIFSFFSKVGLNLYRVEDALKERRLRKYEKAIELKLSELKKKIGDINWYNPRELLLIKNCPELFEQYKKTIGIREKLFFAEQLSNIYSKAYEEKNKMLEQYDKEIGNLDKKIKELRKDTIYDPINTIRETAIDYKRKAIATKMELEKMASQLKGKEKDSEFLLRMARLGAEHAKYEEEKKEWSNLYNTYYKRDILKQETEEQKKQLENIKKVEDEKMKLEQNAFKLAVEVAETGAELRKYNLLRDSYSQLCKKADMLYESYNELLNKIKNYSKRYTLNPKIAINVAVNTTT